MKKYIDKSALVAEIEDWRDKIMKGIFSIPLSGSDRAYATFEYEILGKVRDFIDTLEVKDVNEEPVSNDLEREIKHYVYDPYFDLNGVAVKGATDYLTVEDVADIARHFAQWQKKQEAKEVDIEKEFDNYTKDILACDVQFEPFTHLHNCAKYFYELGLKAKGE